LLFACNQGRCVVEKVFDGGQDGWAYEPAGKKGSGQDYQASIRLGRGSSD
jgi:hypothetical protein